ncbi:alpha/beta hydrolase family protein [Acidihalobacter ferrooxydans]|uniref:Serine aminopeptidase S33 domain-containing protein n=1 Tax=Acidihalobacter ferrooxydans TaxID=1765967 RepID=A0A1P8UDB5_9GAMM|nr:alpha/beta hydrolase [Acidihalobacter ferrooxydans]APZ41820.1 hypothetical protein BW247_00845 [Acidihalobacter ferrooxydans]
MTHDHPPRPARIRFANARGESLAGVLHWPVDAPRAFVLYAACFTCDKDIPVAVRLAHALAQRGYAVLRFDLTGLGESAGDFGDSDFDSEIDDVLHAADWLREHHSAPRLLIGHSLGGAAMLEAAAQLPEARAVVTIGTPATLDHLTGLLHSAAEHPLPDGRFVATIGGQRFTFNARFLATLARHDPAAAAARLRQAYLVLHAPRDTVVPYAHARALFDAAREPRAFVSLDDADHLLRRQTDVDYCADLIAAWASRPLAVR